MAKAKKNPGGLGRHIGPVGKVVAALIVVSGAINVLALTGSFYMLQIYDRALTSRSVETLLALSLLAIGLYAFQGVLDVVRSQILVRVGAHTDDRLAPLAHRVAIDMPRVGYSPNEALERSRDVDVLRQFASGPGPVALLDLPWMPLYLVFVYLLHPTLAMLVLGGALVLGVLTLVTELMTRRFATTTQNEAMQRATLADSHVRNAEVLRAMGFCGHAVARFAEANRAHLAAQMRTSDVGGTLGAVSKVLRLVLQSAVLGLGAYLVIRGELSAGSIIAASVAAGRALSPIDMVIGQWKNLVSARRSYRRLGDTLDALDTRTDGIGLPPPTQSLKVERITVAAPGSGTVVIGELSLALEAGQALGLVGPSGSGKSSLARAVSGVWPLLRGSVRLDDAAQSQWPADQLGSYIGYLPQDVALLDGTIAQNICRFDPDADGHDVMRAAHLAGVHELILRLPEGYETKIGSGGSTLSAGQRQRVALARALYGDPFLVVLDEPNSNLDAEGEEALTKAIMKLREMRSIVIVIAHRPSAIAACDMVGVMQAGKLVKFGPKDEIVGRKPAATPPSRQAIEAQSARESGWTARGT